MQTSTVTVVAYKEATSQEVVIRPQDLEEKFTRGSGPGGQHRNKVETAVVLKHLPTGIQVRVEDSRSQAQNRERALAALRGKLREIQGRAVETSLTSLRRSQAGSGQRGDKVRTIQTQNGKVTQHSSGKQCSVRDYTKGRIWLLWEVAPKNLPC